MAIIPLCKSIQCVNDSVAIAAALQTVLTATTFAHVYAMSQAVTGNVVRITFIYD